MSAVTESEAKDQLRSTLVEMFSRHNVDPEIIGGRKTYLIRCKAGEFRARLPFHRTGGAAGTGQNKRAVGVTKDATDGLLMIEGTASSTSEDWYGTEMSPSCLLGMQAQFNAGIGLFPSHGSWFAGLEWDEEMGRTTEANIETMAMPPEGDDGVMGPGYCLRIKGGLDAENPKCQELGRRLARGQKIGMSIGGWFTEVRYIMDEDEEEIERIIVEKVELDHLAIVRNPANPDCLDLKLLRSVASQAFRAKRAPEARAVPVATPPAMSARSEEPATVEPVVEVEPPPTEEPAAEVAPVEEPAPVVENSTETPSNNRRDPEIADDRSTGEIVNVTESQMTAEDIRALIQTELATRTKLEAEVQELRAKNANLESRAGQSVRKGMGAAVANHRTVSTSQMEQLCTRAKTEIPDCDGIVDMIRSRQRGLELVGRTKTSGKDGEDFRAFCNDSPDFLREVLGEAGENGMLRQWRREMHDLMD